MDELERARAVLSAATPGPWECEWVDDELQVGSASDVVAYVGQGEGADLDARAIALLGSVWPELLAVVEECERGRALGETLPEVDDALDALRARLREHLGGDR